MKPTLTESDFENAAKVLAVDVPAIRAVAEVESNGAGFLPDGRPTMLFERHKFHAFTHGKYDSEPDISNKKPGGYGAAGAHQYDRFLKASALDREAAAMATSWGKFQLMGFNFRHCGFEKLQDFIDAMNESEGAQLLAFVKFVRSQNLDSYLRAHNWSGFARGYNGQNYSINQYDLKLTRAYAKFLTM